MKIEVGKLRLADIERLGGGEGEAVQRDEIPGVVRVGRVLRFRRDAIIAWIDDA